MTTTILTRFLPEVSHSRNNTVDVSVSCRSCMWTAPLWTLTLLPSASPTAETLATLTPLSTLPRGSRTSATKRSVKRQALHLRVQKPRRVSHNDIIIISMVSIQQHVDDIPYLSKVQHWDGLAVALWCRDKNYVYIV